jgi:hypothetical protein
VGRIVNHIRRLPATEAGAAKRHCGGHVPADRNSAPICSETAAVDSFSRVLRHCKMTVVLSKPRRYEREMLDQEVISRANQ